MHGRTGYKRQGNWHCPYSPFDCRVYRTVAGIVVAIALAIVMVQGCRGQLGHLSKMFSSPSSEASRRYVSAAEPFSKSMLSAVAMGVGGSSPSPPASAASIADINRARPIESRAGKGDLRVPGNDAPAGIDDLLDAIALVESNNRSNAVGDGGSAVGAYQIRPIFLRDINRILGWDKYELADRFDPEKSRAMARVYLNHYGRGKNLIEMARQYNGGPRGHLKKATEPFAVKIRAAMDAASHRARRPVWF